MSGRNRIAMLLAGAAAAAPTAAFAEEKVVYRYDARGRLVEVRRTLGSNDVVATRYGFDKADNRIAKVTTGSPNLPPP